VTVYAPLSYRVWGLWGPVRLLGSLERDPVEPFHLAQPAGGVDDVPVSSQQPSSLDRLGVRNVHVADARSQLPVALCSLNDYLLASPLDVLPLN
jgi:hypothetical protein